MKGLKYINPKEIADRLAEAVDCSGGPRCPKPRFDIYPQEVWAVAQSGSIDAWGLTESAAKVQVEHNTTEDSQEWEAVGPYKLAVAPQVEEGRGGA